MKAQTRRNWISTGLAAFGLVIVLFFVADYCTRKGITDTSRMIIEFFFVAIAIAGIAFIWTLKPRRPRHPGTP